MRDIDVQRRENDLVIGTFGRGIYIIDDYSPLRALAKSAPRGEGVLPVRHVRVYAETPFQRAGVGDGLFTGENPPFGALVSYVLNDATPAGTQTLVIIKDTAGKTIAEIPSPDVPGLNRVVWDLRRAPDSTAVRDSTEARQGRGGRGPLPPGPLVTPGTFSAQLARRTGTTLTLVGPAQRLQVVSLER